MKRDRATKYDCAKMMQMSRTTVIKWWDAMGWTIEKDSAFSSVIHWYNAHWDNPDYNQAVQVLNISKENVLLNVATYKEMCPKYVIF